MSKIKIIIVKIKIIIVKIKILFARLNLILPVVHLGKIYFNVVKFSVKDEQIQVLYHG